MKKWFFLLLSSLCLALACKQLQSTEKTTTDNITPMASKQLPDKRVHDFQPKMPSIGKGNVRLIGKWVKKSRQDGVQRQPFEVIELVGSGATYNGWLPYKGDTLMVMIGNTQNDIILDTTAKIEVKLMAEHKEKEASLIQIILP